MGASRPLPLSHALKLQRTPRRKLLYPPAVPRSSFARCHRGSSLFYDIPAAPLIVDAACSPNSITAAGKYLALGLSVLPLHGKTPAVAWGGYQRQHVSPAALRRWARRGLFGNVGIVCGKVSGNLVVLDFDSLEAYDAFRARFPDLVQTYVVFTGGEGWHVYLRVDSLPPSRRGENVELCSEGRQVVAPPSVHPLTGKPYRVESPAEIKRVSDLTTLVEWLESARPPSGVFQPATRREHITSIPRWAGATANTTLVDAIADSLRARGYRQKGEWLNGPCIYPERHAHNDSKISFGFNIRTGYGNCFRCGSMLAKDIGTILCVGFED